MGLVYTNVRKNILKCASVPENMLDMVCYETVVYVSLLLNSGRCQVNVSRPNISTSDSLCLEEKKHFFSPPENEVIVFWCGTVIT